jgi:purine-binding chemotaxis protein CheW
MVALFLLCERCLCLPHLDGPAGHMHEFRIGIIDLRGEITTIVDLKQRLNINDSGGSTIEASRIIVLDEKITNSKMGILVDDVSSVSTFEMNQVDTTSESVDQDDTSILGIIKKKVNIKDKEVNELIIWIDIKPLVKDIKL